ncbi:hypothetical protein V5O48_001013 [Marasmius crinis-equi]|uniref:histone acetyltransferase n=1 Tax=Marasmius crinis-equi TaxID=585013 RepID=A0ABR3FZL9_9AGAR
MVTTNLRDALLNGLKALPGTREFYLHVLVSSPRKHASLYPYSQPRCRSYLQDILILLSEQKTPDSPRIFVTVIEACVYNIPTTSSGILYISKVDSTGQGSSPSPTATLVKSLLLYYADPVTRPITVDHLWIQLFARAQNQYLFPNSAEFSGKRPLSDVRLCGWWKRVYSDVATEMKSRLPENAILKLYYLIPGYSQLEADHSLKITASTTTPHDTYTWTYGHPYTQTDIPLPCPPDKHGPGTDVTALRNLGTFIPSFDDDPKSRFMDEIAYITDKEGIKSPPRKRARTTSGAADKAPETDATKNEAGKPPGELGKVTPDEFWERMSFRQECVAGAATGFFTMGISIPVQSEGNNGEAESTRSSVSPLAPQAGQVSSNMNKRVIASLMNAVEFSTAERAILATETIENAIKGLCEGITLVPAPVIQAPRPRNAKPERPQTHDAPAFLEPPRTPPPRNREVSLPDISPNPFPEPEPTLETYHSFIYGSICVRHAATNQNTTDPNGARETVTSAPQVTVLTARKKKKRAE